MSKIVVDKFPKGYISIPPSKSLLHRELICSFVESYLNNKEFGEIEDIQDYSNDIIATYNCLKSLQNDSKPILDCQESGSTLRFMVPLALAIGKECEIIGSEKLLSRPNEEFFEALKQDGVEIQQTKTRISLGGKLEKTNYKLPGNISSQYISGLLMIEPIIGKINIELTSELESGDYIELTKQVVEKYKNIGNYSLREEIKKVESDYSQAAFFIVASVFLGNIKIRGLNPNSKQGDKKILQILNEIGIDWRFTAKNDLIVEKSDNYKGTNIDASNIPDIIPILTLLLSFANTPSIISNISRLRLKESDRVESTTTTLNLLGAKVDVIGDTILINPVKSLNSNIIDSFNDHRIVMMAAVASIKCDKPLAIQNFEAINKSYPRFFDDFYN